MALNGLDSSNVKDAYKAALAEPGGWLLLAYTSRDEVDVHQRGNGGVSEVAEALTDYPTKSPLYGFLQYRNMKILLKYLPQGTSRLLQARTSVHWATVMDNLSPHDALFEATLPEDLNDEALSALCGLAPEAMPAISPARTPDPVPSPSPRPITPQRAPGSPQISEISAPSQSYFDNTQTPRAPHVRTPNQTSTSAVSALSIPSPTRSTRHDIDRPDTRGTDSFERPTTQPVAQPKYEPLSHENRSLAAFLNEGPPPSYAQRREPELREFSPSPDSSYRPSNDLLDAPRAPAERSGRPSTSDIWRSFKPKLKLHPRPVESQIAAPTSSVRQKLPSGLKVRSRKTEKTDDRPKSRRSEKNIHVPDQIMTSALAPPRTSSRPILGMTDRRARSPAEEPPLPPLPTEIGEDYRKQRTNGLSATAPSPTPEPVLDVPPTPPAKPDRPPNGFNQGRRNPNLGVDTKAAQFNRMSADTFALLSPEKQRLMKALELRKRQFTAAQQEEQQQLHDAVQRAPDNDASGTFLNAVSPAKTDSGVDIEEIRAAEAERSRPFEHPMASTTSLVANTPRPSTARRHNPALQSHPVGDVESFASPPSQPPLPPPPKDLFGQKREHSIPRKEVPRPATSTDSHSQSTEHTTQYGSDDSRRLLDRRHGFLQPPDAPEERPTVSRGDSGETNDGLNRNTMFIRELESATVQEATSKPMHVVQTSVGGSSRAATPVLIERSASRRQRPTPAEMLTDAPAQGGMSPPSPQFVRPSTSQGLAADRSAMNKRVNVSTGISRRIQVLAEMNSGREGRGASPYGAQATYDPSQSFLAPSALPQMSNSSQSFLAKSYDDSRASSPSRSTRRGLARRPSNDSQRTTDTLTGKKRDTVSITAHIQRNAQVGQPLIIEEEGVNGSSVEYSRPMHSRTVSRTSTSRTGDQRPGSSHSNRPVSRGSTVTSFTRTSLDVWRSGGSRRFQSSMRPPTSISNVSLDRVDEVSETNRSSRTSKLLKRMSGIGSRSHKPPSENESVPSMEERRMLSPPRPASIIVGDLNVQFPDSLLWKRRWVEVDGNGNLVLSASPSADRPNGSRKKFHLADFRTPSLPGQDRAEQPHSIKLDFVGGGGTLQLATEDPVGQASILRRLGDAHRAWLYYET